MWIFIYLYYINSWIKIREVPLFSWGVSKNHHKQKVFPRSFDISSCCCHEWDNKWNLKHHSMNNHLFTYHLLFHVCIFSWMPESHTHKLFFFSFIIFVCLWWCHLLLNWSFIIILAWWAVLRTVAESKSILKSSNLIWARDICWMFYFCALVFMHVCLLYQVSH